MKRPDPPKVFDITPEGYHEHNRYFNKAEKYIDFLEEFLIDRYGGKINKVIPFPPILLLNEEKTDGN